MACQPKLRKSVDGCLDAMLPWRCVVCSLESEGSAICRFCRRSLPWNSHACQGCGLPLPKGNDPRCGACLAKPEIYDAVVSPLLFDFPVNRLVHRFKFQSDFACGRVLADILAGHIQSRRIGHPDLLMPVPMNRWRLLRRGMNPAYELANRLARVLGLPLAIHDLRRKRNTPAQSGLTASHRRKNLRGAFAWLGASLNGRHIALVDDVITTGSTVTECTRVLRRSGAGKVSAWSCARAVK